MGQSMTKARIQVIAGFIPLLDCSVLAAAAEFGFAEAAGLDLHLVRETSWANIRDRIAVGHFDVAHMLAPMPIASTLNLSSLSVPMLAPMTLGLGGNAITVSRPVAAAMLDAGWDGGLQPLGSGTALAAVARKRATSSRPPLRFGVVHPFSGHAYELRYWLAAAGLDPDREIEITVLPPPVMPDALANGHLDGYCVGEPWNTVAVSRGTGRIVTCKQAIWPDSPEKVLGVTKAWARANTETLSALMQALSRAAIWCADAGNAVELSRLLATSKYLNCRPEDCLPALTGEFPTFEQDEIMSASDFFKFVSGVDALPRTEHGLWFYSQMVRWGQTTYSPVDARSVEAVFDAGAGREALEIGMPASVQQQVPLSFFDGRVFDPGKLEEYIAGV